MSLRIGLTGGIGSGKTTAAKWLAQRGVWVIDTDAIARRLSAAGGEALEDIRAAFGDDMIGPDEALDRERMRSLVFSEAGAKLRLEAILHPRIRAAAERQAAGAAPGDVVLFDIPLLAESSSWRSRVDRILVIDCEASVQIARVQARSGWSEAEVRRVLGQQAGRAQRRRVADAVVVNNTSQPEALAAELQALQDSGFLGAVPSSGPM